MNADDPRHGLNRGYNAGCREKCCRDAHAKYRKNFRTRRYLDKGPATTDGAGTRRRIQALMALGYSTRVLDAHLGQRPSYTYRLLADDGPVFVTTARKVAAVYDELSMVIPTGSLVGRCRAQAAAKGYAPPLAWDDIDNDESIYVMDKYLYKIDEVIVLRVLDGDFTVAPSANKPERDAIVYAYRKTGRNLADLERATGWAAHRYGLQESA